MLNQDDRNAIEGLFDRLREVERRAPPRDAEAEALIGEKIARQPGAPYYLAQTVLVQEHALGVADRRIRELEAELERRPQDDFLGGLFGSGQRRDRGQALSRQQTAYREQRGPWDQRDRYADNRGGGFLAGAAQTALGVTGGILLGSFIGSMFGAGEATAAEADPGQGDTQADQGGAEDAGSGNDFDGGDFGDGGGFDMGGDF